MIVASEHGCLVWRRPVALVRRENGRIWRCGEPGEADIQGIIPPSGRGLAIEVKMGRDPLRPHQRRWAELWQRHGGLYILARWCDGIDGAETIREALAP